MTLTQIAIYERDAERRREEAEQHRQLIQDIEFKLYKAEHGMGMPYDASEVKRLRSLLFEARARATDSVDVRLACKLLLQS